MTVTKALDSEPDSNVTADKPGDMVHSLCPLMWGVLMFLNDQDHFPRRLLEPGKRKAQSHGWPVWAASSQWWPPTVQCSHIHYIKNLCWEQELAVVGWGVGLVLVIHTYQKQKLSHRNGSAESQTTQLVCEGMGWGNVFCGPPHCHIPLQEPEKWPGLNSNSNSYLEVDTEKKVWALKLSNTNPA